MEFVPGQRNLRTKGANMRLGAYPAVLTKGTKAAKIYKETKISERHRHRYEFNNQYEEGLTKKGLKIVGKCPKGDLVEIVEIEDHPWFVGCQFHPEFKSSPMAPHPLFVDFIEATAAQAQRREWSSKKQSSSKAKLDTKKQGKKASGDNN